MRVWERGSAETLACGTGACASAVACALGGYTKVQVRVHLGGGDLDIFYDRRAEAIRYCLEHAREGDFLVLAGKGHEDYQEIMGKRIPMDDRRLLMEELLI